MFSPKLLVEAILAFIERQSIVVTSVLLSSTKQQVFAAEHMEHLFLVFLATNENERHQNRYMSGTTQ